MELSDRVVLITGGAKRIGRAIALRLARAGCNIAIHYRRSRADAEATVAGCRALGVDADLLAADLANAAQTATLVPWVTRRFGRLDILINNASEFPRMALDDFDAAVWDRVMHVNATAPMILAHAAAPELRRRRGRIVNLCDASTARPWTSHLAYSASKAALECVTKMLARTLAPDVNVVGVAPGVADWPDDYGADVRAKLTTRIPLQRAGTPDDIAAMVHFLLADGDFVTGSIIPVDGGRGIA
ncbi:MAG: SDR family oxidoreductase [Phycisphaerae bacterium]